MSCLEPHKMKEPKFKFEPWQYLWNEIHTFCWAFQTAKEQWSQELEDRACAIKGINRDTAMNIHQHWRNVLPDQMPAFSENWDPSVLLKKWVCTITAQRYETYHRCEEVIHCYTPTPTPLLAPEVAGEVVVTTSNWKIRSPGIGCWDSIGWRGVGTHTCASITITKWKSVSCRDTQDATYLINWQSDISLIIHLIEPTHWSWTPWSHCSTYGSCNNPWCLDDWNACETWWRGCVKFTGNRKVNWAEQL